ncbi:hypothetical protein BST81_16170 [Leptolyngbya sp. 'hensonii']|uniref:energy transducer TonB n=1 Tax=Leptolyngbya sp. 'hensonii' TaxID=1922337 RepID=UPI00096814F4|nr:energy transducer TonB [Leptolyngbya sp. 'hensonii']OLP17338.1 hypothetical protein BST81_16170 [Leptolyngbya sp. 'hensonii']
MAYSAWAHSLPELLRQPIAISVMASLGLHGLFAATFSQQAQKSEPLPETVKVVELTPAERSRLPQSRLPQAFVPQTPLPTNQPPSLSNLFPTLPPGGASPFPPSGRSTNSLPYGTQSAAPWYWSMPPRQPLPNVVTPPANRTTVTIPQNPSQSPPTPTAATVKNPDLDRLIGSQAASPQPSPSPTPGTTPSPLPSPTATTRPNKIPATAIERMRELQAQRRATNLQPPPGETGDPAESVASGELSKWLEKYNIQSNLKTLEIPASSPQNLKGKVLVAVTVDATGKAIDKTAEVIQSSGNESLDQAALDAAKNHNFSPAAEGQAYLIVIRFGDESSANFQPFPSRS